MSAKKNWDDKFLDLADVVASWSKDPSTKVGAVIVESDTRRVLSVGYNGAPLGVDDSYFLATRDLKIMATCHAESNAIDFSHANLKGSTIYITTAPCAACAARIAQNRIATVVYAEPSADFLSRWALQNEVAFAILKSAGIHVVKIKRSNTQCQEQNQNQPSSKNRFSWVKTLLSSLRLPYRKLTDLLTYLRDYRTRMSQR